MRCRRQQWRPAHVARTVIALVGIYDMLRVELDSNGAFNVTEFGTVKDPAQFQAATASGHPTLVRLQFAFGHGIGTALTERIAQQADVFAVLFDQLGMEAVAV